MHMTIAHGCPPPESHAGSDGGKMSEDGGSDDWLHAELRQLKQMIVENKQAGQQTAKMETVRFCGMGNENRQLQLLTGIETRMVRLEKQVEMALNSIYTLVQLQTGMNSSVSR